LSDKNNRIGEVLHRIYLNCADDDIFTIANEYVKECDNAKMPWYFKAAYNRPKMHALNEQIRPDVMVFYCDENNFIPGIKMIDKIMNENPKIKNRCGSPPFMTSKLDKMGIADEPITEESSYTSECVAAVMEGLTIGANAMGEYNFSEGHKNFDIKSDKFLKPFYRGFIAEMENKGFCYDKFTFTLCFFKTKTLFYILLLAVWQGLLKLRLMTAELIFVLSRILGGICFCRWLLTALRRLLI
jgi:hypothetical protein